jgi:hypothetical protein
MNRRHFVLGLIAGIGAVSAGAHATSPVSILKGAKAIEVFARAVSADAALVRLMAAEEIERAVVADLARKLTQTGQDILVGGRNFSSTLPADFVWPAVVVAAIRIDLAPEPTAKEILGAVTLREASLAAARAQADTSIVGLLPR